MWLMAIIRCRVCLRKKSMEAYPAHQGTQVSQTPLCFLVAPEGLWIQVPLFPLVYQALLVALLVPGWALAFDSSHSEKHPTSALHLEHNLLSTHNWNAVTQAKISIKAAFKFCIYCDWIKMDVVSVLHTVHKLFTGLCNKLEDHSKRLWLALINRRIIKTK